jgi:hypothetical protein
MRNHVPHFMTRSVRRCRGMASQTRLLIVYREALPHHELHRDLRLKAIANNSAASPSLDSVERRGLNIPACPPTSNSICATSTCCEDPFSRTVLISRLTAPATLDVSAMSSSVCAHHLSGFRLRY